MSANVALTLCCTSSYDHETDEEAEAMQKQEDDLLAHFREQVRAGDEIDKS